MGGFLKVGGVGFFFCNRKRFSFFSSFRVRGRVVVLGRGVWVVAKVLNQDNLL